MQAQTANVGHRDLSILPLLTAALVAAFIAIGGTAGWLCLYQRPAAETRVAARPVDTTAYPSVQDERGGLDPLPPAAGTHHEHHS